MLSTNSITAGKSLIKNMRLYFKLFFKYVFFYFLIIYSIKAGDVIEKLEELEKKLENNEIIETNLKNKQNGGGFYRTSRKCHFLVTDSTENLEKITCW